MLSVWNEVAIRVPVLTRPIALPLEQLFFMADFFPGHPFTQPCSLHSCGKWPVVDAGMRGLKSSPVSTPSSATYMSRATKVTAVARCPWRARATSCSWSLVRMNDLGSALCLKNPRVSVPLLFQVSSRRAAEMPAGLPHTCRCCADSRTSATRLCRFRLRKT